MRRPPRRQLQDAFLSVLLNVLLALWLVGAISGCGAAFQHPGAAAQGAPTTVPTDTSIATPRSAASRGILQGTLQGTVVAAPTCPVERAEDPCPPRPVPDSRVVIVSPAGTAIATATTDGQGHFQVALAPGTYTVVSVGTAGTLRSGQEVRVQVTVRAGLTTTVTLALDTGIR